MDSRLSDIVRRLEESGGPDRDIDADIYIEFNIPAERVGRLDRRGGCVGWWPKDAPYESAVDVPRYTASLDAAIALVERMEHAYGRKIICFHAAGQLMAGDMDYDPRARPDNSVTVGWCAHVAFFDSRDANSTFGPDRYSYARTPALAVLTALFRALEAKETGNG